MYHLFRTASGDFSLDECFTFEELEQQVSDGTVAEHAVPLYGRQLSLQKIPPGCQTLTRFQLS
jgi:tRNA U55 pseudouridine synthase TruB